MRWRSFKRDCKKTLIIARFIRYVFNHNFVVCFYLSGRGVSAVLRWLGRKGEGGDDECHGGVPEGVARRSLSLPALSGMYVCMRVSPPPRFPSKMLSLYYPRASCHGFCPPLPTYSLTHPSLPPYPPPSKGIRHASRRTRPRRRSKSNLRARHLHQPPRSSCLLHLACLGGDGGEER